MLVLKTTIGIQYVKPTNNQFDYLCFTPRPFHGAFVMSLPFELTKAPLQTAVDRSLSTLSGFGRMQRSPFANLFSADSEEKRACFAAREALEGRLQMRTCKGVCVTCDLLFFCRLLFVPLQQQLRGNDAPRREFRG